MSAITFHEFTPGDVTAYDPRGNYQGRIIPAGAGFEVHTVAVGSVREFHHRAGWFACLDDAKHAFVGMAQ